MFKCIRQFQHCIDDDIEESFLEQHLSYISYKEYFYFVSLNYKLKMSKMKKEVNKETN